MILLTGSGFLAGEIQHQTGAIIVSLRNTSGDTLIGKIKEASVIIHNAANLQCSEKSICLKDNYETTKYVIKLLHKFNPKAKFLYISSMSILSSGSTYKKVKEMSPYAFSKYKSELYLLKNPPREFMSIRFSTIFYRNPKKDGLSKMVYDAAKKREIVIYNEGADYRDFIPLSIGVKYITRIIKNNLFLNRPVNIVSGNETSFMEIASFLKKNIPLLDIKKEKRKDLPKVLSKFNTKDIEQIGKINFSLENTILDYLKTI